jgi:hypothetical protein
VGINGSEKPALGTAVGSPAPSDRPTALPPLQDPLERLVQMIWNAKSTMNIAELERYADELEKEGILDCNHCEHAVTGKSS